MNITAFALRNNRTTVVLMLVILLAGFQSYLNMPRAYDPGFIIRAAQVITYFPGASSERVEQLVSDKLEKVVQEIPELDFVTSESRTGVSIIVVNIKESYKNMRPIWDNLRRKIDDVRGELPDGVIGPKVNDEFGDVYGIVLTITGEGYNYAELKDIADDTRDQFLYIEDVAKVEILGAQEERIFVEYSNTQLSKLNLSPSQLLQMLKGRNIIIPGGSIKIGSERIELEPSGNFQSVEEVRKTVITLPGSNEILYLSDISDIKRGYVDPPASMVHSSGTKALGIAISMREGGNNIEMGENVKATLEHIKNSYPYGVEFEVINFSPKEVENKVNSFASNLVQAILVVAAVMLLSLGFRTGLIVAFLIPASMVVAMLLMSVFNIGLDQISLAALIIALGMLVDNGIVMTESIMVSMSDGKKPIDAAIESANELRVPLLTSSLTTAAAFLPIFLAESNVGEFTSSLFKVVTITLLSSWILSLTIIPLLCVSFLKAQQKSTNYDSGFYTIYRKFLSVLLRFKITTLLFTVLLFASAIFGLKYVPNIFFPPSDRLYFTVELTLPLGTAIETTEAVTSSFESFINKELTVDVLDDENMDEEGITNWISYIGSGGTRFVLSHTPEPPGSNYALLVLNTTNSEIIDDLIERLNRYAFDHFPDVLIKAKRISSAAPVKNPVEVRLYGSDTDRLFDIMEDVKSEMKNINGLQNITDDWGQRIKKLVVKINQQRALRVGVTNEDIAISLQSGLSGLELTQYREDDKVIPVVFRSVEADRHDIRKLQSLTIYSQAKGTAIPLTQVANIEIVWEPAKILRRDRLKTITVGAQTKPGFTAAEGFKALKPWLIQSATHWPFGFRYELGGDAESSQKGNQSIADKLPIAIFIIMFLLVAQFNSIRKSIIILTAIPLGLIGVTAGLLIGQSYFGFMTLLGIISLAGIVINNAIVLLERIQLEINELGLAPYEAILSAALKRFRPILLTTATTVLGLIPLYLGGGEMWEPMALAIMAGLLFSTLLTLGVVPVLYALLFRVRPNN
ncbi:MAG: efflux RND transporter permease subunit [Proteobacteria bacterium]|nr:efflux RND transporter permease subunit [Pseudomonadota bacterium]